MMKILERYILVEFLKLLMIAVTAFILLFMMVDVFENMDSILKYKVPLASSLLFFGYKIPFIISQISPIAVLISVLLTLGILCKNGEITAMKAGGVSLLRVVLPLLVFGAAISAAVMVMNESVTHSALKRVDYLKRQWFGMQSGSFGREGMWLRTSRGIFNIKQIDVRRGRINGVTFYDLEKPFKIKSRILARNAKWQGGRWVADAATVWSFSEAGEALSREAGAVALDEGLPKPENLANFENLEKDMSFQELKSYITRLEADGYEAARYKLDLYNKVSFPLVNFVMVLVGIPFALKTGRYSGIAAGVGLSVIIAFSYWVIFAVTKSLGHSGIIPPFLAAGFPDLLFFAIGALMFGYVRQ